MKRTTTANISGIVFHIDEDAFVKLSRYLKTLKRNFGENSESDETMDDFESRIAELLQTKISSNKQIITIEDIDYVIQIIGEPEEIETNQTSSKKEKQPNKTLFRNPDDIILGGVCSGIAAYFSIDVWIIRLITVLFTIFWGFGLFLYLVLWAFLPVAKTPEQRSRMNGYVFDKEEFEKNIRDNIDEVKQRFEEFTKSDNAKQTRTFIERLFSLIGVIIMAFFSFIGAIIGFAFLIAGLAILIAVIAVLFFDFGGFGGWPIDTFDLSLLENILAGSILVKIVLIALLLLIVIPLFLLVASIIKALSGKKQHGAGFVSFGIVIWIIAISLIALFFVIKKPFLIYEGEIETKSIIDINNRDTLIIKGINPNFIDNYDLKIDSKHVGILSNDEKSIFVIKPKLYIDKSTSNNFELKLQKKARDTKQYKADNNAEEITFQYTTKNDTLYLNTFFEIKLSDFWQNRKLDITILVPEGKTIFIDNSLENNLVTDAHIEKQNSQSVINKYIKQESNKIE